MNHLISYKIENEAMKTFQDLYIYLNDATIEELIEALSKQCHGTWIRATEQERRSDIVGEPIYCFERKETADMPAAGLSLFSRGDNSWFVPNVVPLKLRELTTDQYNRVLTDFVELVLKPALEGTSTTFEISNDEIFLQNVVGESAARALDTFSSCANKSTGSSHPSDQKRWFEFLVKVSRSGNQLPTDLLIHALLEQGWSDDYAHKLAIEFEFAQDLLAYAQDH
ncbi:hypothetical protein [Nitrosomonas marina]|uniref:Uncharacterized protein n=1 Tax=Nitrosomonas marina TaxID=917 RepID=A0A1H8G5Y8_9PROT|nr:hypothetical protein [Nitrosomonas marina]SEN38917.1 hypothetical protein SAMN05216325_11633 [Nitrosomonas marina]